MTRAKQSLVSKQFDLFLPYLTDLPLRDQREMIARHGETARERSKQRVAQVDLSPNLLKYLITV
jgi:hypothetical protein